MIGFIDYIVVIDTDAEKSPAAAKLRRDGQGVFCLEDKTLQFYVDGVLYQIGGGGGSGDGSGDVVGPASSANNYVALFSGATGKLLKQGSGVLGSAAYTASTNYATAAQGVLAGTAVQPGSLGTAAYAATGDFATAAQGTLAGTAVQPARSIATTAPLTGGGDLSANRTLGIDAATTGAPGSMSAADKTKLDGVATGATANATDAQLRDRTTHTGSQTAATVSDFSTSADARIAAAVGVSVQAYDAQLLSLAGLTYAGNTLKVVRVNAAETGFEVATLAGGGDALTSNSLVQFAETTSAELRFLLTDETGGGAAVFALGPTLVEPDIGTPQSGVLTNCTGLPTAGLVNDAVTYAKIQNVSASRLLGRASATSGDIEEVTLGTNLSFTGTVLNAAGGGSGPTVIKLAAEMSSTSVTRATVTDGTTPWSFAVTAGNTYRVTVIASYQTAATTTGGTIGVNSSGGAVGTIHGRVSGGISTGAQATELGAPLRSYSSGAGSTLTTTGVSAINTPHHIGMEFVFDCTTSGTLLIEYATEVAGSASQLNAGSVLLIQEL